MKLQQLVLEAIQTVLFVTETSNSDSWSSVSWPKELLDLEGLFAHQEWEIFSMMPH